MKVLIVDDNEINRKLLRVTLATKGHETVEAADGIEALEKLSAARFDAVITDILMPNMDGYRLCYRIRQIEGIKDLPVIIFSSTYTSVADEQMAGDVGADRFLRKPAASDVILQALEDAVRAPRPRGGAVAPGDELDALKQYSEGLVRRLEDANRELEAARDGLAAAYDALRESGKSHRDLIAFAPIGIFRSTREGRFLSANAALAQLLGYESLSELLKSSLETDIYFDSSDRDAMIAKIEQLGGVGTFDVRWKRREGARLWVRLDSRVVQGKTGGVEYETFVHDIHHRKRAEEALKRSEERFRLSFSVSPVAMSLSDPKSGRILDINERFATLLGYGREEVIGKSAADLDLWVDPADREQVVSDLEASRPIRERDFRLRTKTGQVLDVVGSIEPLQFEYEQVLLSAFKDMTARKRGEEKLRISEERYRLLFESNPVPMWVFDNETLAFLAVNEAACRHYGYSRDEFLSMTIKDIRPPGEVPSLLRRMSMEAPEHQNSGVWTHRKKDGTLIAVEITSNPFVFDGRVAQLVLANDITERLQAEEGMRKSEERFRKLFESNTMGIVIADLTGGTRESNQAYLDMIGYTQEELRSGGIRWDQITPPEYRERDQEAVEELQRTGAATPWEKELIRKDGSRVPVLMGVAMLAASEASCIAYIVDLSGRRLLEEQFRQAQKMEAVGQLAGGVAHDFNNLLTAILGYSDLLAGKIDPDSEEFEELGEIRRAGERAAALTRQLLAFSRQQVLERKVLDVNDLIREIGKMLHRLIGEDVELVTVLDPALRRVRADAGQLEQVVMNLAVNARDAMPRGGKLTIESANVELDEAYARVHATVRPGTYVMIAVSDTGVGMNAETLSRIFEPFFTTKERGKGTGLGLATVYGIVKQSGGYIWVYSEVGKGTTFKIYLPPAERGAEEEVPESKPAALHGSETVLLVEDEESVRALSRAILERYGYTVLDAKGGQEALSVARPYGGPIHLVLTDVVMPSMSGTELVSRLEALRPGIRVLYMSGYTDDAVVRHGLVEKGRVFLQKPFTPQTLARKVREALRSGEAR